MTEDGAVFGGQNNLHEGLENAYTLYKPKMIAVFTSCMPEVIGDDQGPSSGMPDRRIAFQGLSCCPLPTRLRSADGTSMVTTSC